MWQLLLLVYSRATFFDWFLLGFGILLLLYVLGTRNYNYFARHGIFAERPLIPFVGNTTIKFLFGVESFPSLMKNFCRKGRGHSIIGIFEFQTPTFMVRNPEMLKIIGVKEFDHFMNHRSFVNEENDPFFGKNLTNLQDQRWRDMRTTLSPAFTSSKIKGMFPLISKCAQQMVDHLNTKIGENPGNEETALETNMKDLFTRMANDVIATVAFGLQCDSLKQPKNEFYENGKSLTTFSALRSLLWVFIIMIPKKIRPINIPLFNSKATSFFDFLIHRTIKERQQNNIFRPDMLQLLMQAREGKLTAEKEDQHESENIGKRKSELTDEDITAQAVIFFFAGFETVSTVLCFTSLEISRHPEMQRRLQQEVDEVWERTEGNFTYEDVQKMKYLDAVISESLRKYPPLPAVDRVCGKDTVLPAMGATPAVTIRKGQGLYIPIIGIHHDEELWPDPERFDPERFNDENKNNIKPFSYLPFGLGSRFCIAQRFALVEVKLVLAYLLRNFELEPSPKTKYPVEYENTFNVMVKGGFWSFLKRRKVARCSNRHTP